MTHMPWAQPVLSAKECAGQHKQQILAGLHLCLSGFSKQLPLLYKERDFGNASFAEFPQLSCPTGSLQHPGSQVCWRQVRISPCSFLRQCSTLISAVLITVG